jgi:hypothetical protein
MGAKRAMLAKDATAMAARVVAIECGFIVVSFSRVVGHSVQVVNIRQDAAGGSQDTNRPRKRRQTSLLG